MQALNKYETSNKEMFCPLCQTILVSGQPTCYETLDDHICRPNDLPPVRSTTICPNRECKAHWAKVFWGYDGEGPFNTPFGEDFPWADNNPIPFNSYHRQIYFSCSYHNEDRKLSVGKLTVRREVTYASDDYGHKTGKRTRYSIWWNRVLWIPGYRMFLFSLRQFYKAKKSGLVEEQVRGMVSRSKWPRAEWWRKAACWWVRSFHPTIYKGATN